MSLVIRLFALWLLLAVAGGAAFAQPRAAQGRLQLDAAPREALPLAGDWGFAWQRFVDPHWEQVPTTAFTAVPGVWNDVTADGKTPGENGWGSYLLRIDCPAGERIALEPIGQRTASRLYVNGELVAAHGRPDGDPAQNWAAIHNRVPITREFACPLRLTLHIANHDHRGGGFVRPMYAGTADALAQQRETRLIRDAALLTAYTLTGVVSLLFFAVRRREKVPLVFGLFCVCMAVYTDMIGERVLLRPLAPQVSWHGYMQVEYVTWLAALSLFLITLRLLFPQHVARWLVATMVGAMVLSILGVLVLPPGLYSHWAVPGQALAVGTALYAAVQMARAERQQPGDAKVLLAGFLVVLVSLAFDLAFMDQPGSARKYSPIGFALFLLSPALVITRRMSQALNAEERSHTLEENAKLREDVERMSRHDLKTPLNSILGVTRLLREDVRLNTEQRELVGVLQRAGLRMLEMVNLSLGLYRMETGRYDFRPQAVDLREVVTRVLVDLHSLAEAGGVVLHLRGSDRRPLYVRGEEPLCYSIVANVVRNAMEASTRGDRVTLALQRTDPVTLMVHNPGAVPPEVARQFFDKYSTSGKSAGTGLGTYSARLMARAQEGDLQMRTSPQGGTTLVLTLRPLRGEPPQAAPQAAEGPVVPRLSDLPPREVLLVDDDEFTRLVTRRLLPSPPFSVETAANGLAAMDAMARRWPDLLLIDMEMPLQGGLETVRWVREQEEVEGRPRCNVVMMSGNDDEVSAARALQAGADRFLVKPVSREALLGALRELEDERRAQGDGPAEDGATAPAMPSSIPTTLPLPLEFPASLPPSPPDEGPDASRPADDVVAVDPAWAEFFPDFVRMQRETAEAMARALAAGDREDVHFLAHRATGGLATMGLEWAAAQTRAIEREAALGSPERLAQRIEALRGHLRRVRLRQP